MNKSSSSKMMEGVVEEDKQDPANAASTSSGIQRLNEKETSFVNIGRRPALRGFVDIFPWLNDVFQMLRTITKSSYTHIQLIKTMDKYIRCITDDLQVVLRYPNRSFILSKNISAMMYLFRELNTEFDESNEYLMKIVDLLGKFAVLELKHSTTYDEPRCSIANRISVNIDAHLRPVHELYILHVFLNIRSFYQQKEIMKNLYQKYLMRTKIPNKKELPDKLFVMYLIAFKNWKLIEDDDNEKIKIEDYANAFMKPRISLRLNRKYAPFIPAYKIRDENATKSILSQYFNPASLVKAIKVELVEKKYVTSNVIVDLSDDVPKVTSATANEASRRLSSALSQLSIETSFGKTIKLERPEVVATIDLTAEDHTKDREKSWLNFLRRKSRDSQPVMHNIYREPIINEGKAIIDLDDFADDEIQIIEDPADTVECSTCMEDIVTSDCNLVTSDSSLMSKNMGNNITSDKETTAVTNLESSENVATVVCADLDKSISDINNVLKENDKDTKKNCTITSEEISLESPIITMSENTIAEPNAETHFNDREPTVSVKISDNTIEAREKNISEDVFPNLPINQNVEQNMQTQPIVDKTILGKDHKITDHPMVDVSCSIVKNPGKMKTTFSKEVKTPIAEEVKSILPKEGKTALREELKTTLSTEVKTTLPEIVKTSLSDELKIILSEEPKTTSSDLLVNTVLCNQIPTEMDLFSKKNQNISDIVVDSLFNDNILDFDNRESRYDTPTPTQDEREPLESEINTEHIDNICNDVMVLQSEKQHGEFTGVKLSDDEDDVIKSIAKNLTMNPMIAKKTYQRKKKQPTVPSIPVFDVPPIKDSTILDLPAFSSSSSEFNDDDSRDSNALSILEDSMQNDEHLDIYLREQDDTCIPKISPNKHLSTLNSNRMLTEGNVVYSMTAHRKFPLPTDESEVTPATKKKLSPNISNVVFSTSSQNLRKDILSNTVLDSGNETTEQIDENPLTSFVNECSFDASTSTPSSILDLDNDDIASPTMEQFTNSDVVDVAHFFGKIPVSLPLKSLNDASFVQKLGSGETRNGEDIQTPTSVKFDESMNKSTTRVGTSKPRKLVGILDETSHLKSPNIPASRQRTDLDDNLRISSTPNTSKRKTVSFLDAPQRKPATASLPINRLQKESTILEKKTYIKGKPNIGSPYPNIVWSASTSSSSINNNINLNNNQHTSPQHNNNIISTHPSMMPSTTSTSSSSRLARTSTPHFIDSGKLIGRDSPRSMLNPTVTVRRSEDNNNTFHVKRGTHQINANIIKNINNSNSKSLRNNLYSESFERQSSISSGSPTTTSANKCTNNCLTNNILNKSSREFVVVHGVSVNRCDIDDKIFNASVTLHNINENHIETYLRNNLIREKIADKDNKEQDNDKENVKKTLSDFDRYLEHRKRAAISTKKIEPITIRIETKNTSLPSHPVKTFSIVGHLNRKDMFQDTPGRPMTRARSLSRLNSVESDHISRSRTKEPVFAFSSSSNKRKPPRNKSEEKYKPMSPIENEFAKRKRRMSTGNSTPPRSTDRQIYERRSKSPMRKRYRSPIVPSTQKNPIEIDKKLKRNLVVKVRNIANDIDFKKHFLPKDDTPKKTTTSLNNSLTKKYSFRNSTFLGQGKKSKSMENISNLSNRELDDNFPDHRTFPEKSKVGEYFKYYKTGDGGIGDNLYFDSSADDSISPTNFSPTYQKFCDNNFLHSSLFKIREPIKRKRRNTINSELLVQVFKQKSLKNAQCKDCHTSWESLLDSIDTEVKPITNIIGTRNDVKKTISNLRERVKNNDNVSKPLLTNFNKYIEESSSVSNKNIQNNENTSITNENLKNVAMATYAENENIKNAQRLSPKLSKNLKKSTKSSKDNSKIEDDKQKTTVIEKLENIEMTICLPENENKSDFPKNKLVNFSKSMTTIATPEIHRSEKTNSLKETLQNDESTFKFRENVQNSISYENSVKLIERSSNPNNEDDTSSTDLYSMTNNDSRGSSTSSSNTTDVTTATINDTDISNDSNVFFETAKCKDFEVTSSSSLFPVLDERTKTSSSTTTATKGLSDINVDKIDKKSSLLLSDQIPFSANKEQKANNENGIICRINISKDLSFDDILTPKLNAGISCGQLNKTIKDKDSNADSVTTHLVNIRKIVPNDMKSSSKNDIVNIKVDDRKKPRFFDIDKELKRFSNYLQPSNNEPENEVTSTQGCGDKSTTLPWNNEDSIHSAPIGSTSSAPSQPPVEDLVQNDQVDTSNLTLSNKTRISRAKNRRKSNTYESQPVLEFETCSKRIKIFPSHPDINYQLSDAILESNIDGLSNSPSTTTSIVESTKKKRGRPKGSKNKKKTLIIDKTPITKKTPAKKLKQTKTKLSKIAKSTTINLAKDIMEAVPSAMITAAVPPATITAAVPSATITAAVPSATITAAPVQIIEPPPAPIIPAIINKEKKIVRSTLTVGKISKILRNSRESDDEPLINLMLKNSDKLINTDNDNGAGKINATIEKTTYRKISESPKNLINNSEIAKTYSKNSVIQNVFVPPDVEKIIEAEDKGIKKLLKNYKRNTKPSDNHNLPQQKEDDEEDPSKAKTKKKSEGFVDYLENSFVVQHEELI